MSRGKLGGAQALSSTLYLKSTNGLRILQRADRTKLRKISTCGCPPVNVQLPPITATGGAVLQMKVGEYFVQGRRRWVRLHEKGGKEHDVPCHHNLDHFLDEYIAAAGIPGDPNGCLFRTTMRKSGVLTEKPLHTAGRLSHDPAPRERRRHRDEDWQSYFPRDRHHCYLKNSGKLGSGAAYRHHESPRTTKLYDRRQDEISLDEIERIAI